MLLSGIQLSTRRSATRRSATRRGAIRSSATRRDAGCRRARQRGFTLIEVLVTLFIIGVLAGVAVLRMGSADQDEIVDREAQRLRHLMGMARDEALLGNREWALELSGDGYGFLRLDRDTDRWGRVEDPPFASHALPDDFALRLSVEGRDKVGAADARTLSRSTAGPRPALLFLSSGEMTPFQLDVIGPGDAQPRRLTGDGFGQVRFAGDDEAANSASASPNDADRALR